METTKTGSPAQGAEPQKDELMSLADVRKGVEADFMTLRILLQCVLEDPNCVICIRELLLEKIPEGVTPPTVEEFVADIKVAGFLVTTIGQTSLILDDIADTMHGMQENAKEQIKLVRDQIKEALS